VRIERVALDNFLAFKAVSVEFAPGLNVVLSPNEGGKSSLFRGIATGFYASAATRSSEVIALARWGSAARFRIEIDFTLTDGAYRLVRDFDSREQTILRPGEHPPIAKGKAVDELLGELLPIADENLFLRVCGVRHEELALVADGSPGIGEAIEEILGGGRGSATPARVQRAAEDKRKDLIRGRDRPVNEANRGPIRRYRDEVERLERDAARASAVALARERLLGALSEIDAKLILLDADIELARRKRDRASKHRELERDEKAAREKADDLRKRKDRLGELFSIKQSLVAEASRFPESLMRGSPALLDGLRADFERESLLDHEAAGKAMRGGVWSPLWRPVLAAMLALAGVAGAALGKPVMLACLAAGALLAVWHFARGTGRGEARARAEFNGERERLAAKRIEILGGRSLEDSKALLAECSRWKDRARDVESRIDEAAGTGRADPENLIDALDREYGGAALALRAVAEARAALDAFKTDADGMLKLERETERLEGERARLAAERAQADRDLAALERIDGIEIAERLAVAREGLRRAERKERVLGAILETLAEARRGVAGILADRLPPLAASHLARITGGRYETLFIDPLTLRIETVPARGDAETAGGAGSAPERIDPGSVSQGARDQIYLAVRLALVELMSRGEPQPLFLDDPFVHFDPDRRERSLELLREFAAKHQVVIFTCDPRYRDCGAHLVELPARA
jgi:DNA repair exonuclease SbcCD ATPase subunit